MWQYAAILTGGTFEEARMPQNVEACDWLAGALHGLEPPFLDANYATMRAVCSRPKGLLAQLCVMHLHRSLNFLIYFCVVPCQAYSAADSSLWFVYRLKTSVLSLRSLRLHLCAGHLTF